MLCPPYLSKTYPQFETVRSSVRWVRDHSIAAVFIFKNDGTKPWKRNVRELEHVTFKKKYGMQLKGTESGQSVELGRLMRRMRIFLRKRGVPSFPFLNGHCDICSTRKCPRRDNPPCPRRGMPSMEAIGIDVYKLLEDFSIPYEHPVETYVTAVTMALIPKSKRE